jgi:hypothetical protein
LDRLETDWEPKSRCCTYQQISLISLLSQSVLGRRRAYCRLCQALVTHLLLMVVHDEACEMPQTGEDNRGAVCTGTALAPVPAVTAIRLAVTKGRWRGQAVPIYLARILSRVPRSIPQFGRWRGSCCAPRDSDPFPLDRYRKRLTNVRRQHGRRCSPQPDQPRDPRTFIPHIAQ